MRTKNKTISFKLEKELFDKIHYIRQQHNMKLCDLVELALKQYIAKTFEFYEDTTINR